MARKGICGRCGHDALKTTEKFPDLSNIVICNCETTLTDGELYILNRGFIFLLILMAVIATLYMQCKNDALKTTEEFPAAFVE